MGSACNLADIEMDNAEGLKVFVAIKRKIRLEKFVS